MFFIRFIINFCISFVILSIPVNEKTIFNHLYRLTESVVSKKIKTIKKKSKSFFVKKAKSRKNINQEKALSEFSNNAHKSQQFHPEEKKGINGSYTDEEREIIRRALEKN